MATAWLLHGIICILLICTNVAAPAKLDNSDPQRALVSQIWRKEATLTSFQRTGSLPLDVSAQTNGFLQFSDAPMEHVRASLVRSEAVHPRATPAAAGLKMVEWHPAEEDTLEGEIWDFVPDSMGSQHTAVQGGSVALNADLVKSFVNKRWWPFKSSSSPRVNSTGSLSNATEPRQNLTAAGNDWSGVKKNVNSSDTPPAENVTDHDDAADDDWSAVRKGAGETNETNQEPVNSASNKTDVVNVTSDRAPVNATSVKALPAPAPVPAAAAPAPPITIINKIINKVNVTVHVNVTIPCRGANCTQDGTTVSSKASIPTVTNKASGNSSKASKSSGKKAPEDERNKMDIWKSIVKSGRNSSKTGERNARSDSSL